MSSLNLFFSANERPCLSATIPESERVLRMRPPFILMMALAVFPLTTCIESWALRDVDGVGDVHSPHKDHTFLLNNSSDSQTGEHDVYLQHVFIQDMNACTHT